MMQIAFVAGNTYTFVQLLSAMLFLATQDRPGGGYSLGNGMVSLAYTLSMPMAVL